MTMPAGFREGDQGAQFFLSVTGLDVETLNRPSDPYETRTASRVASGNAGRFARVSCLTFPPSR